MRYRWLIMVACVLMTACGVPKVVTVTEYRDRVIRDTVTAVDSVYVSHVIRERGDTIFVADTVYKFRYIDKYAYIHVRDSIPYEVQVVTEVRRRNGYDRFVSWSFWILLVLILVCIVWTIYKRVYLRRT